jgi:hypothetical protein
VTALHTRLSRAAAIEKSLPVDPAPIQEHMRSKAFAMPQENPALDEATRTLVYLATALAGTNRACVQAMSKRLVQNPAPIACMRPARRLHGLRR